MPAVRDRFAPAAPPPNDVYTGLLLISLLALLFGCVLLFLDYNQYEGKPPQPPTPSAASRTPPAQPGAGQGAPQDQQPPAGGPAENQPGGQNTPPPMPPGGS